MESLSGGGLSSVLSLNRTREDRIFASRSLRTLWAGTYDVYLGELMSNQNVKGVGGATETGNNERYQALLVSKFGHLFRGGRYRTPKYRMVSISQIRNGW